MATALHMIENLMALVSMDTVSLACAIVVKITLAILNVPPLKPILRAD